MAGREFPLEKTRNIGIQSVEVAKQEVEQKVDILIEEDEKTKLPSINGVLLASLPVNGYVSSRFGNVSRIRSGAHTGTDIAEDVHQGESCQTHHFLPAYDYQPI